MKKPKAKSRTLWINGAVVAVALGAAAQAVVEGKDPVPALCFGVLAGVNYYMRLQTTTAVGSSP
jgi:hypothetical protein